MQVYKEKADRQIDAQHILFFLMAFAALMLLQLLKAIASLVAKTAVISPGVCLRGLPLPIVAVFILIVIIVTVISADSTNAVAAETARFALMCAVGTKNKIAAAGLKSDWTATTYVASNPSKRFRHQKIKPTTHNRKHEQSAKKQQAGRQIDTQIDRQTDNQTDNQIDRKTD